MYFFITLLTGIALSLDAFSLSIVYGTILRNKKTILILSLVVGLFHFFMPFLGHYLSNLLISNLITKTNIISFIIFLILGIQMFMSKNDDDNILNLSNLPNILLFSFTVSIDSFSIGIAIANEKIIIPMIIFSIVSAIFTFAGLIIGKSLTKVFGKYTSKLGGIILIILSIYYLFT